MMIKRNVLWLSWIARSTDRFMLFGFSRFLSRLCWTIVAFRLLMCWSVENKLSNFYFATRKSDGCPSRNLKSPKHPLLTSGLIKNLEKTYSGIHTSAIKWTEKLFYKPRGKILCSETTQLIFKSSLKFSRDDVVLLLIGVLLRII